MAPKKKSNSKKNHRKPTTTAASSSSSSQTHPRELLFNILSRVPVKSLLRFKLVSKQWRHVITHRDFISLHLRRSPPSLIIHSHGSSLPEIHKLHLYIPPHSNAVSILNQLHNFPAHDVTHRLEIIGSTNGVVCVSQHLFAHKLILWNPATRVYRAATPPRLKPDPTRHYRASVGFGFDPSRNDYKIVRIITNHQSGSHPDVAEVFSLKSGRWKTLSLARKFWVADVKCDCVIKGVPYWVCTAEYGELSYLPAMACFNVTNEVFDVTLLPWCTEGKARCLGEIREGRIGAVVWEKGSETTDNQALDVWIREEESGVWNKLYTIELDVIGKVLAFYGDRGILQEVNNWNGLGSYMSFFNLENRVFEYFYSAKDSFPGSFKAVNYKESLVHIPMVGHCII